MARLCKRPGCKKEIATESAYSEVTLHLERRPELNGPYVITKGELCSHCSNDLMDWWTKK